MLSSIPTPTPQVNCGHWKVTNLNWPFSHRPACWSWPPAAAPGGGRSSEPPGGCRSVYAPSPTAPTAALSRPYHPAHRRLHRVWRYSSQIALEACDGSKDHQNNFQKGPQLMRFILFAGVIHCQLSQGEGKVLPWWWCGGGGFNWRCSVVSSMVDFWGGRCRGFRGGDFLYVGVQPWLGAFLTKGLVEGAA